MKKIICVILALVCSLALFAGCNTRPGEEPVDPNKTQISVAIKNDSSERAIMTALKTAFEKENQDIQIMIENTIGGDYVKSIFNYAVSEFPDILWTSGDYHATVSAAGKFVDLKPYYERDIPDWETKYHPVSMASTKMTKDDDSIWFAPRDFNQIVVYFNKTAFETAKQLDPTIKDPLDESYFANGRTGWTWEEFKETCEKLRALQEQGNRGEAMTRTSVPVTGNFTSNPISYTLLRGFGGDVFDADGNFVMDSDDARDAYTEIAYFVNNDLTSTNGSAFTNKLAAMTIGVRPAVLSMSRVDFDVAPFPQLETDVVGAGCSGYAISSECENVEAAWRFLKFVISREGQEVFGATKASVPVLLELLDDEESAWRQSTPDINNEAFVLKQEQALDLNFTAAVTPANQSSVMQEYNNFFYALNNEKRYYQSEDGITELLGLYKEYIERAARQE